MVPVIIDDTLRRELQSPGFDRRGGVNFICRPPHHIVDCIGTIQTRLSATEPDQYYYPAADLHLTLFEISHSQPLEAVEQDAQLLMACIGDLAKDLPQFELSISDVFVSERSCTLQLVANDDRLEHVRDTLRQRLARFGYSAPPRHSQYSPHITFVRYLQPVRTTLDTWKNLLDVELIVTRNCWTVSEVWLTWGATWFGMQSRITQHGPFGLGSHVRRQPPLFRSSK
jgi:2'-5' RNA ligase